MKNFFLVSIFSLLSFSISAQSLAILTGTVRDSSGKALPGVTISIVGVPGGTTSMDNGNFTYAVPAEKPITVSFNFIGYREVRMNLSLMPQERREVRILLSISETRLPGIVIEDQRDRGSSIMQLDPKNLSALPNASGNFEAVLKTLPGVSSNNELSSQYNVRGGNYDENLVYVNDIEIYRPFLVRSGQQEGLSFINSDMVSAIQFSAGGFDAKYGDKMSSVLDIKYKRPKKFGGSAEMSLLGGNLNLEGVSKNKKVDFLFGIRHKSNQYLLNTLDTKGDYQPSFTDMQSLITFHPSKKWEFGFLTNYSQNLYRIVPEDRETNFGTVNEALRLKVYFEGEEKDKFETYMGALSSTYQPNNNLKLKLIFSVFRTFEEEAFDIQGQYFIDELEKDLGKDNFGEVVVNRGVGTFLNHARTQMDATVYNAEHKGYYTLRRNFIQWGIKYQHESITDKFNEWKLIDSADYSLPKPPGYYYPINSDEPLLLQDIIHSKINVESDRYSSYIQNSFPLGKGDHVNLTTGIRASYWTMNEEFLVSPRVGLSYKPHWKRDFVFRAATGIYYQPPFYRELRDFGGKIHSDLKAQRSIHYVLGSDFNFKAWGRPFKYVTEIYYKQLDNLVPYKIDNVRIRYFANNNAHGYATGIDMRLNGEFVNGIESWASLSIMQTQEDIEGDFYVERYDSTGRIIIPGYSFDQKATDSTVFYPGYIPRPTDQLVTFSIFFQDYLPKFPTYKMHLNLVFGSKLPFGPPSLDRYKDTLRMPPYRRVDLGFSKQIIGEKAMIPANMKFLKSIKSMWLSLEVFNILDVSNTISYLWVADVRNRRYAVPNYLTGRQINVRLVVKF